MDEIGMRLCPYCARCMLVKGVDSLMFEKVLGYILNDFWPPFPLHKSQSQSQFPPPGLPLQNMIIFHPPLTPSRSSETLHLSSIMDRNLAIDIKTANSSASRTRTISNASTSSSSSSSSTSSSLSRRKFIRDHYKHPWQLLSVFSVFEEENRMRKGIKSPYPTPGRRNYERV